MRDTRLVGAIAVTAAALRQLGDLVTIGLFGGDTRLVLPGHGVQRISGRQ
jgi:hypothetical protein